MLPKVTYLVLCYNNEKFVQAALASALGQSYENIEYIIIDDCSGDNTYDIIVEYLSNKNVSNLKVVKNEENIGTLNGVFRGVDMMSGDLLIVAAGDDVSLSTRVGALVEVWRETGAAVICSDFERIDENGELVRDATGRAELASELGNIVGNAFFDDIGFINGATACYEYNFLKSVPRPKEKVFHEDQYINFYLVLKGGRVEVCLDSLVLYRQHSSALVNSKNVILDIDQRRRKDMFQCYAKINLYKAMMNLLISVGLKGGSGFNDQAFVSINRNINNRILHNNAILNWSSKNIFQRISLIVSGEDHRPGISRRWLLLRLFGDLDYQPLGIWCAFKSVFNRLVRCP